MNTPANSTGQGAELKCCAARQGLKRLACRSIEWIDDRTGVRSVVDGLSGGSVPRGGGWSAVWPSMIVFAFVVQVITGFFLWIFYSPSAQTAWESVYYLEYEVAGGWLLRGVHHYSAQILVALSACYVIWLIVSGKYRAPRECVYWVAVLMGLGSLGLCLTGDLLAWDQNSYASTLVRTKFLMLLPVVGDDLFKLAAGGPAFGHLTLTRFFALHIGVFASGFFVLLLLHARLVRRAAVDEEGEGWHALAKRGHVPGKHGDASDAMPPAAKRGHVPGKHGDASDAMPPGRAWPSRSVCLASSWLAVMVIVGLLVGRHALWGDPGGGVGGHWGVGLGAPADPDPANFYAAARPEWSFRGLYQLSHLFPGDAMPLVGMSWKVMPIFQIPGVLLVWILLMPFLGRGRRGHWINVSMLAGLVGAMVVLSAISWWHDAGNPEHQAALAAGRVEAERVKQLARSPDGIPMSGALSLLRTDPKTQGPRLFKKQCAVCHAYSGPEQGDVSSEPPSAPNLRGFATRDWLAGFFNPERITTPQCYGNTKFASGVMARYVEGPFSELKEEEQAAIVAALSAEARLRRQHELDRKDQELIQEGRELISAGECTRCHRFHDHGKLGDAPDLTGYGSPEWIMGIVIDPTHDWFYHERNDRMPAYLETPAEPEKSRLSAGKIALLADWLRGEWYEPSQRSGRSPDRATLPGGVGRPAPIAPRASHAPPMFTVGAWATRRAEPAAVPETPPAQARALFKREHCAICHDCTGAPGGDFVAEDPSAPDLGRFASREWITGLLDPERIKTRKYFGNSKFRGGEMVDFVESLEEDDLEEMATVAIALSAEARLPSQREADQAEADRIEKGRQLVLDLGCTDCHRFHGEGDHVGPDLTGYGSPEWIRSFLCDPAKENAGEKTGLLFYGEENYGMPSYRKFRPEAVEGESPESLEKRRALGAKEKRNLLDDQEIQLLVDMLRGELPESGQ